MIITIDGPAGSGKSTAARKLAARLGWAYLDTGAMYRAVALKAVQNNIDPQNTEALIQLASDIKIELTCGPTHVRVHVDGLDVTEAIRTLDVSQATPAVARIPQVRQILVDKQRHIAAQHKGIVAEGRDQGSVVFPDADLRFFMDASVDKRADRRYHELLADGEDVTFDQVRQNVIMRDQNDLKQWAPLLDDPNVIRIETSHLTIAQVVDRLMEEIDAGR
jgi:cytidylate kinase